MRLPMICALAGWAIAGTVGCTAPNPLFSPVMPVDGATASGGGTGSNGDGPGGSAGGGGNAVPGTGGVILTGTGGKGGSGQDAGNDMGNPLPGSGGTAGPIEPPTDGPITKSDVIDVASDRADTAIPSRLVGYWRFEDSPTGTMVADSSGRGHHGVLENLDPRAARVAGRVGQGLELFRARNDEGVRVAATPVIDNMRAFTIALWFYRTDHDVTSLWSLVSRQAGDADDDLYNFTMDARDLIIFLPRSAGVLSVLRIANVVSSNQWIHAACTYDGRSLRVYINGLLTRSTDLPDRLRSSTAPLFIGTNKNGTNTAEPFDGVIDELAIFSEALTGPEVLSLKDGISPLTF